MHKSVLLQESIDALNLTKGKVVIDLTVGAGGHSRAVLDRIGENGKLLAFDKDVNALALAARNLKGKPNVTLAQSDFRDFVSHLGKIRQGGVDAIIADLGVSSMQLDTPERGFSFSKHAKLDMRMDQNQKFTAEEIVNTYPESELVRVFKEFGEEKSAKKIARAIINERTNQPIIWTDQLAEVVRRVKRGVRADNKTRTKKIDPATKIFQALRIETNKELTALESALPQMVGTLKKGGRIAIISFHSLEDRIVKRFFEDEAKACVCPPDFPVCTCDARSTIRIITKKPITASEEEQRENPRARSAKLRVAEKL